jgi:hypothetical protein
MTLEKKAMANERDIQSKKGVIDIGQPLWATHGSPDKPLKIGNAEIPCYVLSNGMRILSGRGMQEAFGLGQRAGDILKNFLTSLLARPPIKALAHSDLLNALENPIRFKRPGRGGRLATGYEATILADICELILAARQDNLLVLDKELVIAKECEILTRGFARVGIIALVDEVTGYQEDRAREALEDILRQFISDELMKWVKTFPDDFYRQLFKLRGWQYHEFSVKRPSIAGKITNDIIYERLAPGVLDELRRLTPKDTKGRRKHRYFQRLTEDIGHPKLREHIASVITLMKASTSWRKFYSMLNRALPRWDSTLPMALDFKEDEEDTKR